MHSMTGYGKAEKREHGLDVVVEIKSVNNRYLDIFLRLPRELSFMEYELRERLKKKVVRGKISVNVNISEHLSGGDEVYLNEELLENRLTLLEKLRARLADDQQVSLDHLLQFPELFELNLSAFAEDALRELVFPVFDEALETFNRMRNEEGLFLAEDIARRLNRLEKMTNEVRRKGKRNMREEFDRMCNNVYSLVDEGKIDPARLEQEVAVISDKIDITEECVRMASHIQLFRQLMEDRGEVGKKMTFILQEMLREANTMNSKTTDVEISHTVINMKEEIEKMREQAQNLE
ncbi:MAG TPA: YicC family protein [Caldithrix abyssi]|uniref:YicC family protein n=1 Tax=Caldithrix abyssi TaxID=187145 RepID=A0A7V4U357_CALAY|nr:YicC family protein [Caldithrix abyssi]